MKFKLTVLLAAVVVAMGLLPGTSAAQAATVINVAAEGDTLLDETVLKDILLDGGVAINHDGLVAFGGRDGGGIDAVFTRRGKVVAEGEELVDGTILGAFRPLGEVAINAGQLGDTVAFHGIAITGTTTYTPAVFTQSRKVAAVGDVSSFNSTLVDIDPVGKVAINYYNEVAFHGSVKIQGDVLDPPPIRAVFISAGGDTLVVAREDTNLLDDTYLANITESGGVAISDFGEVAFHGDTGLESGSDTLKAVFTSNGLIAKEGDILPDETILENINENGGVAINYVGEVAFHGQAVDPAPGSDSVKAVFKFNQDGSVAKLVAKEGDILPDRTPLDEIEVSGGVAINLFGDVVFHGRTGGVKAVFTQNGLVAKVGDLDDKNNILDEIHDTAGVAINPYGSQVAFHGKIGTTDAVFVGSAPDETLNNPPVADFSFTTDGLKANFTDESTDPDEDDIVEWLWDFGDRGGTSPRPDPDWSYNAAGTYTVTLTVKDNFGGVSEPAIKQVEVTEPPPPEVVLVFATSEGYQGDFGGPADADAICQERATAAGLPGTWTAWLSDDNTDAIDRIPEPGPDGNYQLVGSGPRPWPETPIVADDLADLTDGLLNAPINVDEYGEDIVTQVWTGTQPDGTRTVSNCSNWTNAEDLFPCPEGDPACGSQGDSSQTSGGWTQIDTLNACSARISFYCFSTGQ
jgi:PKD repeat protein